jgi:5-methylthioadenosine/S-adenosylhomocysteine deaminase
MIEGATIITMDRDGRVIEDGAVAIRDGSIVEVGRRDSVRKEHRCDRVLDARGKAIIPGFVNAHTHNSEKLLAGLYDDLDLYSWLQKVINPMMIHQTREDCYFASLLAQLEMIKSGITCFSDLFDTTIENILDTLLSTVDKSGMRAVLSREIFTRDIMPDELRVSVADDIDEKMIADTMQCVKKGKLANGRATMRLGIGGVSYASQSLLSKIRALATKSGIGIHVHVAESTDEMKFFKRREKTTPVKYAHKIGLLGPDVLAAHCVWLDREDIRLLKETGTKVAYNPVSNMKLADGVAPIPQMLEEDVGVGLGTDGAASNDNLDMFACMRLGSYLQKVAALDPSRLPSKKMLEMATIGGAKAIQKEHMIGSVEAGKKADLTLIDLKAPNMVPVHDIITQIVCSGSPSNVDTVIIDGEIILQGRHFTQLNETAIVEEAQRRAADLVERMKQ